MNIHTEISKYVFSKSIQGFGTIHLRYLNVEQDAGFLHEWVTKPYASYWGMLDSTIHEVREEYAKLVAQKYYDVFIGEHEGKPIFLMEKYKATADRIAKYYKAKDTDYGMHILVAPPTQKIKNFTWNVFSTVLDFFFDQPNIDRIVVEPDVRNEKIHKLNKKAGFQYQKEIELPEKRAALAFCEKQVYQQAKWLQQKSNTMTSVQLTDQSKSTMMHLSPEIWKKVNLALVRKAISEFAHERVFIPQKIEKEKASNTYVLISDTSDITYEFNATKRALDHWDIDEQTIVKKKIEIIQPIEALTFIVEFKNTLGIPEDLLAVYLEEITSTLSGAAYKYANQQFSAQELIHTSFQMIEHAMTEGHPCFVANNGRIGFDSEDYMKYAPEANHPFTIIWLAGHNSKTTFTSTKQFGYKPLMRKEIGISSIAKFNTKLQALGLDIEDYTFIPVHPWQWNNKIQHVFAADIANQNLVFLGESEDHYSAQQSIRTLYNCSNPEKMYTKTALSILNMGFVRGLSPYYMKSTPHITNWITKLLENDPYLKSTGFTMLGEVATVGFQNTYYEVLGKTNAHNKMLSALWRESPHNKIEAHQNLMTMAAFLHIDNQGNSFLAALINASGNDTLTWVRRYLHAYLSPLLHCFYKHELVFMPHGENIIMVMEDHTPVHILMKDITEEVIVFNKEKLFGEAERLYTKTSDEMKVLTIFTDVFDCFFRFMSSILEKHSGFEEDHFWQLVAECILIYQSEHPEFQEKYDKYDLFIPEFDRCCLNRLQLRNTKQMLNLGDPIESLILDGMLQNPIARFKTQNIMFIKEDIQNVDA
ncbi:GNAT family N-acetyltransferase [Aquimarina algicola]|uniref:GNAT family N-acetyltransferase n=1 Tax=Aquimarina algicola TaxID=2589995 RepID=A0A504JGR5_9FLAO|nr:GNAT family N-acetyltransferase [Aquimarina algicola]TPN86863.1 GNAT family N-acetyltransferase [Aquimarina algicola]